MGAVRGRKESPKLLDPTHRETLRHGVNGSACVRRFDESCIPQLSRSARLVPRTAPLVLATLNTRELLKTAPR
jgi:hypothetical protein